jgi:ferric-dicitrate binding protein FerR (iron transport regulator)
VLGVVVGADRAYLNNGAVSEGATVYDGDHFSTEAGGMLRLRGDGTTLDLAEESAVIVRCRADGVPGTETELSRGTLVFGATRAAALEITAQETLTRPAADTRTIGQVSVIGPRELRIYARRGALQFSYRGETRTIAEGESYRVILDPLEDEPKKKEVVKPGRQRKAFLFVAIGGGAVGAAVIIFENHRRSYMESPDRP